MATAVVVDIVVVLVVVVVAMVLRCSQGNIEVSYFKSWSLTIWIVVVQGQQRTGRA